MDNPIPPSPAHPITREEFDALAETLRQCLSVLQDFRRRERHAIDTTDKTDLSKIVSALETADVVRISTILPFGKISDLAAELSRLPEADRPFEIIKRVSPRGGRPTYLAVRPQNTP